MKRMAGLAGAVALAALSISATAQDAHDFSWVVGEGKLQAMRSIPSMSMAPTLLTGDSVAVVNINRAPQRGDVVIFSHPKPGRREIFVNRIVGLPGDTVEVRNGRLILNGVMVPRSEGRGITYVDPEPYARPTVDVVEYNERLPGEAKGHSIHEFSDEEMLDETPSFVVPAGHFFMMGDNRDNSEDSRAPSGHRALFENKAADWANRSFNLPSDAQHDAIGFVPAKNIIGRVVTVVYTKKPCSPVRAEQLSADCLRPNINKRL